MKVRKISLIADGRFDVESIEMAALSIDSVLSNLGVSRLSLTPADTVTVKDGAVIVELAMVRAFTWNRFVFIEAR